jgi:hypothetical protein
MENLGSNKTAAAKLPRRRRDSRRRRDLVGSFKMCRMSNTPDPMPTTTSQESRGLSRTPRKRFTTLERIRNHAALRPLPGTFFFAFVLGMPLFAQTTSVSTSQVNQLPLSGRGNANGSVSTTQSITNTGGGNSVNIVNSTVNLTSPYSGSVPDTPELCAPAACRTTVKAQ